MKSLATIAIAALLLAVTGCAPEQSADQQQAQSASQTLVPADAALEATYNRSCRNCHTIAATGAPLTGDTAGWQPRMEKGMDTLLNNVVNGFGGMPPFGMCMDCSAEEFEALILFMAEAPR